MDRNESLTHQSLVERLKNREDQESWRAFFDKYWRLIYATARKTGLTEAEAEEVVQETVITVARKISDFQFDPARCTFKGWLLRIARFKILDQFRKRAPSFVQGASSADPGTRTATVERVPDPNGEELEAIWDEEWTKSLFQTAMDRVKRKVNPGHFQMFYLNVVDKLGIREVARIMRVNAAVVYMAKSRVARAIKNEIKRMEEAKTP